VSERSALLLFACIAMSATGFYVMAGPRRLFVYPEDRARFRPEAVEYDSPQGRRMRRLAPFYAYVPPVVLLAYWLLGGLKG
jgi:hypothetical protein